MRLNNEEKAVAASIAKLEEEKIKIENALEAVDQVIEDARKSCAHRVFHDEPGFLYDIRFCDICGSGLGFI